jgi:hypothetical protein
MTVVTTEAGEVLLAVGETTEALSVVLARRRTIKAGITASLGDRGNAHGRGARSSRDHAAEDRAVHLAKQNSVDP